jgi:hypothetical protein
MLRLQVDSLCAELQMCLCQSVDLTMHTNYLTFIYAISVVIKERSSYHCQVAPTCDFVSKTGFENETETVYQSGRGVGLIAIRTHAAESSECNRIYGTTGASTTACRGYISLVCAHRNGNYLSENSYACRSINICANGAWNIGLHVRRSNDRRAQLMS